MAISLPYLGEIRLLAAIFDLVKSRAKVRQAETIRRQVAEGMSSVEREWGSELAAKPALTAGDSVELLVKDWRPLTFFFHLSLASDLKFRVGLGAGRVDVLREFADECDGPAFWSARSALEKLNSREARGSLVNFEVGEGHSKEHLANLRLAALSIAMLAEMPEKKKLYCFRRVWLREGVGEIAKTYGVSKGNVSKALRGTACFILSKLVEET